MLDGFRVAKNVCEKRRRQCQKYQSTIKGVVNGQEIAVLFLIEHHESIVLFNQMVIGPKRCDEKEFDRETQCDQQRADQKKQQRTQKQALSVFPFRPVQISSRY